MPPMILCVCNAVTENEVRDLARSGVRTPEEAYAALGYEPECGSCLCYAEQLMAEERSKMPGPRLRIVS